VELLRPIFQGLGSKDLCAVARACRTMQAEAEYSLYQNVAVTSTATPRPIILMFCKSICASSRLAPIVRSLNMNLRWGEPRIWLSSYLRLIARALGRMTALRSLRIWFPGLPSNWILSRCTAKLRFLFVAYFVPDNDMFRFLSTQDELLCIQAFPGQSLLLDNPTTPQLLPKLSLFSGNSIDAFRLMAHSPIRVLGFNSVDANFIARLGDGPAFPVRELHVYSMVSAVTMGVLSRAFPDLRVLDISTGTANGGVVRLLHFLITPMPY
jgi:hypothetical protein